MIKVNFSLSYIFIALLFAAISFSLVAEEILIDEVVASVNDEVVMRSELEERALEVIGRLQASNTKAPPEEEILSQVLDRLVIERIQLLKAKQAGIRYSDEEVNNAISATAQRQGKTLQDLLSDAQRGGISPSIFRQKVREQLLISRVQEGHMNKRVSISEQAIDNFLNTEAGRSWAMPDVNLGHIMLPVPSNSSEEAISKVKEAILDIYFQIKNNQDFKAIAIARSKGREAKKGGDMGWKKADQLPEIFMQAIENISPGQISEPIKSDAGFHILKLYSRRGGISENLVQQHNVQHILLIPNEVRNKTQTLKAINKIRAKILNGEKFTESAKLYSEDIGTSLSGGSLGWSVPGQFQPKFEEIMAAVNIGDVSEAFETTYGWHILQVTERREQDFSDDIKRSQARNTLKQKRFKEELEIWLKEIRDEAFIDIKL
jgi:peptidyl-prolyl cis-trans isomerase SurA